MKKVDNTKNSSGEEKKSVLSCLEVKYRVVLGRKTIEIIESGFV